MCLETRRPLNGCERWQKAEALEMAIGTGRVAVPLVEAGVIAARLELCQPMIDQLRSKMTRSASL